MSSKKDVEMVTTWGAKVLHEKIPRGLKAVSVVEDSVVEIEHTKFRIYKEMIDVNEYEFDIQSFNLSFVMDLHTFNEKIKQLKIGNVSELPSHKLSFLENGYSIEVPPPLNWWQRIILIAGVGLLLLMIGLGLAYYRNVYALGSASVVMNTKKKVMEIARKELR